MNETLRQVLAGIRRHWIIVAILAIIVVFTVVYIAGYRVGPGLTLARVGTLEITDLPLGSQVYIDFGRRGSNVAGIFSAALMPDNHTVIVNAPEAYPWEKIVTIKSQKTTTISPLLVPKAPRRADISSSDIGPAIARFLSVHVPTAAAPLTLGCSVVSVANNQVVATPATSTPACVANPPSYLCAGGSCGETIIYSPAEPISGVIAYPGRTDALIVSTSNHVYALGLDPNPPQTFVPLDTGTSVRVAPYSSSTILVSDGSAMFGMAL